MTAGRYYVFSNIKIMHEREPDRYSLGFSTPRENSARRVEVDVRKFCVIDYNTGRVEELTDDKVREILKQDPKLLDEYDLDDQRGELTVEYIRRYNERHPLKNN
jgi:hypothetical protein